MGELIRVLQGTHAQLPANVCGIEEQFLTFFPLRAAVKRNIVSFVCACSLPASLADDMPLFRVPGNIDPSSRRVTDWWLWDGNKSWRVDTLSDAERHLPVKAIINDALLIERLQTGWVPADYF